MKIAGLSVRAMIEGLYRYYILSVRTFRTVNHFELHLLTFLQFPEPACLDRGKMDEDIARPVVRGDEPVTLGLVEPLHNTCRHTTNLF
jgi:hypothetical protein